MAKRLAQFHANGTDWKRAYMLVLGAHSLLANAFGFLNLKPNNIALLMPMNIRGHHGVLYSKEVFQ